MKLLMRRILMITVLVGIAAAIVYGFIPSPVEVEVAQVQRGPMQVTVDEEGKTRVRQRYIVSSPLAGRLQRITLEDGDPIANEHTILAAIAPSDPALLDVRSQAEAEARVRQAQAAVQRAQALRSRAAATLEFAQSEKQRLSTAIDRNAATRHEYEAAITAEQVAQQDLRSEEFGLQIANFELEQARAALLRTRPDSASSSAEQELFEIRSPIDGRVFRVLQKSAMVVQPGTPLIELGDPRDLEIVIDALSTDAVKIQPGAAVMIERWGGNRPLHGTVRLVEPSGFTKISALGVEEQRVNIIVDFQPPAEETAFIGDGFRIEGRIVIWQADDVIKAPTSALFRTGSDWSVFVLESPNVRGRGRAVLRRVSIGQQNGLEAQILAGLQPGEIVILHPSDRIKDGVRVQQR